MIYLLLLLTLPLLITPQEHGSHIFEGGNPLSRMLKFSKQESRSIGGVETKPHAWPWMVQLVYMGQHFCGGSLIDPSFVVTAAHCVANRMQLRDYFTVYTGGHTSLSGQAHKILNISMHPLYNLVSPISYDFAIIKISPAVKFDDRVQPISLPLLPPPDNKICVVAGWGVTRDSYFEPSVSSSVLREIRVPIIPAYVCNDFKHYMGRIHVPSMICARMKGGLGACFGDSGGPLMCERDGKWELQGVASFVVSGCGRDNHPDVYSRVLAAVPFLKLSMFLLR